MFNYRTAKFKGYHSFARLNSFLTIFFFFLLVSLYSPSILGNMKLLFRGKFHWVKLKNITETLLNIHWVKNMQKFISFFFFFFNLISETALSLIKTTWIQIGTSKAFRPRNFSMQCFDIFNLQNILRLL